MDRTSCLVVALALLGVSESVAQCMCSGIPSATQDATAVAITPVATVGLITAPLTPQVDPPIVAPTSSETRLVNLSTRARVSTGNPLIAGFAITGTAARPMLVRAAGPGLAAFGVPGALAAPRLELRASNGTLLAMNNGWGNDAALAGAFAASGAFPFTADSADSAAVATLAPGNYTLQVFDAQGGSGGIVLAEIYDLGDGSLDSRLVNASSRSTVSTETTSGFILTGAGTRQFLIRGIGPGLTRFGVGGVLVDPRLSLFDSAGRSLANNNDWSGGQGQPMLVGGPSQHEMFTRLNAAAAATGAFPLEQFSADAAVLVALGAGGYTIQMSSGVPLIAIAIPTNPVSHGAAQGTVQSEVQAAASAVAAAAVAQAVAGTVQAATTGATSGVAVGPPGVALLEIYELP